MLNTRKTDGFMINYLNHGKKRGDKGRCHYHNKIVINTREQSGFYEKTM